MLALMTWSFLFWHAESLVLDPALYLSPSPPLTATLEDPQWTQPRHTADLAVIPIEQIRTTPEPTSLPTTVSSSAIPEPSTPEMMDKSDKLLQLLRTSKPAIGPYLGIHVPLTFSLTGTYGRYGSGNGNLGVMGSSYGSISDVQGDAGFSSLYGRSGLAGSSYGAYGGYGGTRIYGSSSGAAWSGWGNGKWGHYGKG